MSRFSFNLLVPTAVLLVGPCPILADDIFDPIATRRGGWPIRMFLVKQDGTVGYTSINGPFGFRPDDSYLNILVGDKAK